MTPLRKTHVTHSAHLQRIEQLQKIQSSKEPDLLYFSDCFIVSKQ